MSMSTHRTVPELTQRGRLWWLPASGVGNGLDADNWAPVVEVEVQLVPIVLERMRARGVPAFAAPAASFARRLRAHALVAGSYRIWVASTAHAAAEDVLMQVLRS